MEEQYLSVEDKSFMNANAQSFFPNNAYQQMIEERYSKIECNPDFNNFMINQ